MTASFAFILSPGALTSRPCTFPPGQRRSSTTTTACTKRNACCSCERRVVLGAGAAALFGFFVGPRETAADESEGAPAGRNSRAWRPVGQDPSDVKCKNCLGGGTISCELCSGTGFWRALANNDVNQRYQGVVCPECEGDGTLRCPVCLGTGEGNIRGLLRRRRVEPGPGRILQTAVPNEEGVKK